MRTEEEVREVLRLRELHRNPMTDYAHNGGFIDALKWVLKVQSSTQEYDRGGGMMVIVIADKNIKLSLNHELSFRHIKMTNRTGHEVKLDIFIINEDTLLVEVVSVD